QSGPSAGRSQAPSQVDVSGPTEGGQRADAEILGGEAEGQGTDVVWTHSTSTSSATRATEANRRHGASIFTSARSRLQPLSTSGWRGITVPSRCGRRGRVVYPAARRRIRRVGVDDV